MVNIKSIEQIGLRIYEIETDQETGARVSIVEVPPAEPEHVFPVIVHIEPLKLNIHKHLLEQLLAKDLGNDWANAVIEFFLTNSKAQYLLALGDILVAPYIDLIITLITAETMDETLKTEILAVLNDLKGSI